MEDRACRAVNAEVEVEPSEAESPPFQANTGIPTAMTELPQQPASALRLKLEAVRARVQAGEIKASAKLLALLDPDAE